MRFFLNFEDNQDCLETTLKDFTVTLKRLSYFDLIYYVNNTSVDRNVCFTVSYVLMV